MRFHRVLLLFAVVPLFYSLSYSPSAIAVENGPLRPSGIAAPGKLDARLASAVTNIADAIPAASGETLATDTPTAPAPMDLTSAPTSLWTRVRNGFGLPDISSALVREQEEWYAQRPDYIKRTVARSSRYLYYIIEQVEKRGMPSEIALLPIIESAYNPIAYSRAHASGIWQFIPSTGKLYGLQQNFWYDGRRDVMAATDAALDYLQKLYDMFGSWDLALAAYNWGEGAVSRAIAKNVAKGLPTDYQNLTLPAETRYYIPKLQAVKNIIANPIQFGVALAEVPNQPYFVAVSATKHMDVKLAAKLAGMPLAEFISLNPGNSGPVIQANTARKLLVPADKADAFLANLENHDEPLVSWQAYRLKTGENLNQVAARSRISLAQLKEVNGITNERVAPGSTLLIPGAAGSQTGELPAPSITFLAATKARKTTHLAAKKTPIKTVAAHLKNSKQPAVRLAKKTPSPSRKIVLAQIARGAR